MWIQKTAGVVPLVLYLIASQCNLQAFSAPKTIKSKLPASKQGKAYSVKEKVQAAPAVEKYLLEGKLEAGETALLSELKKHPTDDQLRFGLGSLQFLLAIEKLSQAEYRYGLGTGTLSRLHELANIKLPLTTNPNPEVFGYKEAQEISKSFLKNLESAEATLAEVKSPDVKLPLHFGMIRLDLNGDGQAADDETLWRVYSALDRTKSNIALDTAKEFYINFDRGDVNWLRGYCQIFMGISEVYLAHDSKEIFDCTAHLFFNKVDSPYKFLSETNPQLHREADILDVIALIHLIHCPVVDSDRMLKALHHFEAVPQQSKESWKWIMAEKDDDHEWLPNPKQTGIIPNVHVSQEMVDTWLSLMDQSAKILTGERLVPFWRGNEGYGINVKKLFTEPKTFDLVMFIQGPGAAPYLEKGEMTEPGTMRKLQSSFGNEFPGFAIWFN